jgi:hypothetical protein
MTEKDYDAIAKRLRFFLQNCLTPIAIILIAAIASSANAAPKKWITVTGKTLTSGLISPDGKYESEVETSARPFHAKIAIRKAGKNGKTLWEFNEICNAGGFWIPNHSHAYIASDGGGADPGELRLWNGGHRAKIIRHKGLASIIKIASDGSCILEQEDKEKPAILRLPIVHENVSSPKIDMVYTYPEYVANQYSPDAQYKFHIIPSKDDDHPAAFALYKIDNKNQKKTKIWIGRGANIYDAFWAPGHAHLLIVTCDYQKKPEVPARILGWRGENKIKTLYSAKKAELVDRVYDDASNKHQKTVKDKIIQKFNIYGLSSHGKYIDILVTSSFAKVTPGVYFDPPHPDHKVRVSLPGDSELSKTISR